MNHAKNLAIEFFKRNKDAEAAHIVLDRVTGDLKKAKLFQRGFNAKKVSSFTRTECAEELGEPIEPIENSQLNQE